MLITETVGAKRKASDAGIAQGKQSKLNKESPSDAKSQADMKETEVG